MAGALAELGVERALVVHSVDGLDEISIAGPTSVREITSAGTEAYVVTPEDFGIETSAIGELQGGDPETNARIFMAVLEGDRGAARDCALMNAGAALLVSGRAGSLKEGTERAGEALDSGAAMKTLVALRDSSRRARAAQESAP
jgi:anthranilate phosphoribosyltransferase